LKIGKQTIKTHRGRDIEKLGVESSCELLAMVLTKK
jgi:DNA-binding CsgD family transcriptional regulator